MAKNTPSIIFKMQAFSPDDNSKEADFYRCRGNKNVVDYMLRKSAQDVPDGLKDDINNMLDILNNSPNYIDYMTRKRAQDTAEPTNENVVLNGKSLTTLFDRNGFLTVSDVKKTKEAMAKTNSIVWVGIVSFTPEMASKICSSKAEAQALIAKHFPKLIEGSHLDADNITMYGDYHVNTDNPHIHLSFFEREPLHIKKDGSLAYSKKIVLPKKNFDNFKYAMAQETLQEKLGFSALRNPIKDSLRVNIANDKFHLSNMVALAQDIIDDGHFQYNRLSKDKKKIADKLVQYALKTSPTTLKLYESYRKETLQKQTEFFKIARENNLKPSFQARNFYNHRMTELNTRLGNTVLKIIKNEHIRQTNKSLALKEYSGNKNAIGAGKFIKLSNSFDLTKGEFKKIVHQLVNDFKENVHTQSVESFKLEKKLKGENLIFEEEAGN